MYQPDERSARGKELLGEIQRLTSRLDRFLDLYGENKMDRDALERKVDEARKRRQSVEEDLSRLDAGAVSQRKNHRTSKTSAAR